MTYVKERVKRESLKSETLGLMQRCPTHSPLATCGQSRLKTIGGPRQNINEGPHNTNFIVCYSILVVI